MPSPFLTQAPTSAPYRATIDLTAVSANVAELDRRAGSADVMAVVKADAYGHGLVPCALAALRGGATWLGTAQLGEAVALREAGIGPDAARVLTWLHAPGQDLAPVLTHDIDLGVSAPWSLDALAALAREAGRPARVHLKVDTGLGRNGAYGDDLPVLVDRARQLEAEGAIEVVGVFTHFAFADAPTHPTVTQQQRVFAEAVELVERAGCRLEVRHMANSAACLTTPEAAWDLVRPGLAVYGLSPVPDLGAPSDYGLTPAMRLSAEAVVAKRVPAGQGVSYGHTWVADEPTTLVDVPLGYSDGIPRSASNAGPVLIGGQRHRIAGRVCMDQFVVAVGDQAVEAGAEVVLFGPGTHGEPTAEDWALASGTISYEIVTRIGTRVPRVYTGADAAWLA